jgi:very-long-chain enoyl-CoA reductase
MPFRNVFKNSAHYWLLSGVNMAYWMYSPNAPSAHAENAFITWIGIWLFLLGELCNLSNHITLRQLRRPGTTDRGIPLGIGFSLVTCPNYMFECLSWVGVFMVTRSFSVILFLVVAAVQMGAWAKKKERRYRKEFGDKYKPKKFVMLPGIY